MWLIQQSNHQKIANNKFNTKLKNYVDEKLYSISAQFLQLNKMKSIHYSK